MLVARSVMEQRYEAVMAVLRDGEPVTEVAARFGVSRQSVHAWIRRYERWARRRWRIGRIGRESVRIRWRRRSKPRCASCAVSIPGWGPTRLAYVLARQGVDAGAVALGGVSGVGASTADRDGSASSTQGLAAVGAAPADGAVAARRRRRDHARRRDRAQGAHRGR